MTIATKNIYAEKIQGNLSITSVSATTISATTYQNLPAMPYLPLSGGTVTGQTIMRDLILSSPNYNPGSSGNIIFFSTPSGLTYSSITSRINGGGSNGDLILQVPGNGNVGVGTYTPNYKLDVNGSFGATSVSATTYFNLPNTVFTGGTVSGATNFTGGLTANTISATTYNLKTINTFSLVGSGDISISGGVSYTRQNANNTTNDAINYCGIALGTGVTTSAAAWTITQITVATEGSVTTAVSAPNSIWNNRQSISYT